MPPAPPLCRGEEGQQAQPWLVTSGLCFHQGGTDGSGSDIATAVPPHQRSAANQDPPHTAPWGSRATKEAVPIQPQRICALRGGEEPNRGCVPPHPPTRPSHAHLPDEAVGGGVRRGAAIRALEAALALAVLALQRGVTGLGGALWASLPRHPQQHRFRTEHRELLRSAPPAATTQHPQTPTHQSGGGGQDALGGRGGWAHSSSNTPPTIIPMPPPRCHMPQPHAHTRVRAPSARTSPPTAPTVSPMGADSAPIRAVGYVEVGGGRTRAHWGGAGCEPRGYALPRKDSWAQLPPVVSGIFRSLSPPPPGSIPLCWRR